MTAEKIIRVDKSKDEALSVICNDLWCKSSDVTALEQRHERLKQAAAQMAEALEINKSFVDAFMAGEFLIEHYIGTRFDVRRDAALAAYREATK